MEARNNGWTRRARGPRFHQFCRFPLESRDSISRVALACPGPRLIEEGRITSAKFPVAVVRELGVVHLTTVGKAGFFLDGNEFWDELDERAWLWDSDTEANDHHVLVERLRRTERRSRGQPSDELEDSEDKGDGDDDVVTAIGSSNELSSAIDEVLRGGLQGRNMIIHHTHDSAMCSIRFVWYKQNKKKMQTTRPKKRARELIKSILAIFDSVL
ncbi:hypothetical protein VTL71DRAFT_16541 [Oculimacula yallundae]|uniref:Uncharacterized protein n=1 Tax=Oculimacula yallundae TaxID=86028 RepID=A0ABR4CEU9_9HELO